MQAAQLLPFQRTIVEQTLQDDCVCVMAPGLGMYQIIAVLLQLHDVRSTSNPEQMKPVLIIGASPRQRSVLSKELDRIHPMRSRDGEAGSGNVGRLTLPVEVTAEIAASERLRLYASCSSVAITTRILVVDFLTGRLDPSSVAGIIILNAHKVTESSGEGFAVRLYRMGNTVGFLRAFSDAPVSFSSEFGKPEKILKALQVKHLHLWPRFQVEVQSDLETGSPPELVELSVPCDRGAALVYEALTELVDACVKELRKHERLDTTDLQPSQGLSSALDEKIRRQLAPVWHTVGPKTRQIVSDLRTLRVLATFLTKMDPITFLSYLETLRSMEGTRSAWLFHSAAHTVFEAAKSRVYTFQQAPVQGKPAVAADTGLGNPRGVPIVQPVLEELPKWQALIDVLREIKSEAQADGKRDEENTPILIFCQDDYTCDQLRKVISSENGGQYLMLDLYQDFLQAKSAKSSKTSSRKRKGAEVREEEGSALPTRPLGGPLPGEEAALAKEARTVGIHSHNNSHNQTKGKKDHELAHAYENGESRVDLDHCFLPGLAVQFVALDVQGPFSLWEYNPKVVIIYDPDVALTRALELFNAQRSTGDVRAQGPLQVYLLRYEDSPEMDKYQAAVVRERSSFESIIRAKGHMAPPTTLHTPIGNGEITDAPALPATGSAANALTRRAGGKLGARSNPIRVIVDVREFMSHLPAVLHMKGLELVPVTLEVGDYVLSPELCVERKTLADLRSSLQSGRLYQQAEAMCKHYKTAILLIEFDGDRAFALQGAGELGDDIHAHSIMSRLVLLCLHHPRLRVVWSRSLHATADIFQSLKSNHEEPDPVIAATMGLNPDDAGREVVVNTAAIDVLRRLPGVTDANWRSLMRESGSLSGLARLPLARLITIMGGEVPARKLHEFLSQECKSLFKAL